MKGPGLRIGLDVRRVWRCAVCGRTLRTSGQLVAQRCGCSPEGRWMTLQPDAKREPFRAPPREPIPDDDAAPGAGEIAAAPVSIEAAPALQTLIDVSPAAGFAAAIPADVVPPGFEPTTAATPSQEIEKSADQTTGAAPSSGEAAGLPDEFGAGLGN